MPLVEVVLRRSGGELTGVRARVSARAWERAGARCAPAHRSTPLHPPQHARPPWPHPSCAAHPAQVVPAAPLFLREHPALAAQFASAGTWPKHLLVRYAYDTQNDVDLARGLKALLGAGGGGGGGEGRGGHGCTARGCMHADACAHARTRTRAGLLVVVLLAVGAVRGVGPKLAQFLMDVSAGEAVQGGGPGGPGGSGVWKGGAKGE